MVAMFASYLDLDLGTLELVGLLVVDRSSNTCVCLNSRLIFFKESENSWKTKVAWLIFDHFVTKLESLEEVK